MIITKSCGQVDPKLQLRLEEKGKRLAKNSKLVYQNLEFKLLLVKDNLGRLILYPGNEILPNTPKLHWGAVIWNEMHKNALLMSAEEFSKYIQNLVLPCDKCRIHWEEIKTKFPFSTSPFPWSVFVHNQINQLLGKPELSLEQAHLLYA